METFKNFVGGLSIAVVFFGFVFLVWRLGGVQHPKIVEKQVEVDTSSIMYDARIEKLKDDVVAKLRSCESAGYKESEGLIVFDSNKKASIGTLQWQVASIIYYYKTLRGEVITGKQAILIALDDHQAGELAKEVMFGTPNKAGKDWYNCATRHGIDSEIDIIKKLEKK